MQATCPRCGNSHVVQAEGPAVPCPTCGYTAIVVSAAPPAARDHGEPVRWGSALAGCMAVSALVLVCALLLARLADADRFKPAGADQISQGEPCQSDHPVCVDPSLWAADTSP